MRQELAGTDLAEPLAFVGQAARGLFDAADEQIGGTTIDRHGVDLGLCPRAVDHRLVVAGDEAVIFAKPRDAQGQKMFLKESLGSGAIRDLESLGRPAGIARRNDQSLAIGGGGGRYARRAAA